MPEQEPVVRPIGVKKIKVTDLEPNPHNPRMLFDDDPMKTLNESIGKVGILVPLTVYEKAKKPGSYVILDGQRRWICAQEVGLKTVPVNVVAEPSTFQNIVTMFQIHKLREDWELMPTALKLEVLMKEMKEKNDKKLAELTGMDEAVVTRCKKLLSFEDEYKDMMLLPDPEERWKADFFIELYAVRNDRTVNEFEWFDQKTFTDQMIKKYNAGALKAVTDFRIVKQHISNASKVRKLPLLSKRLREFAEKPELKVDHLEIEAAGVAAQVRRMTRDIGKLRQVISEIDADQFYGEEAFWNELESLVETIQKKLKELGRRAKR
jgi:ParB family transcriptional regulator, chromosome partitioning protein